MWLAETRRRKSGRARQEELRRQQTKRHLGRRGDGVKHTTVPCAHVPPASRREMGLMSHPAIPARCTPITH